MRQVPCSFANSAVVNQALHESGVYVCFVLLAMGAMGSALSGRACLEYPTGSQSRASTRPAVPLLSLHLHPGDDVDEHLIRSALFKHSMKTFHLDEDHVICLSTMRLIDDDAQSVMFDTEFHMYFCPPSFVSPCNRLYQSVSPVYGATDSSATVLTPALARGTSCRPS